MRLVLFLNNSSRKNPAAILMNIHASLFVYIYRNIKGLSAAIFVLCHPVDLLEFNQKVIPFFTLLQNSKR